jgi:pseudouridine-5'-monophosphatase
MPKALPAACLFDLDGLLLDTEPLHGHAWLQAAAQFDTALSPAQLLSLRGRRRHDCADQVLRWIAAAGGHCPGREALLAVRQPIAEALMAQAAAMPGAEALVRRCRHLGLPMALATSSSREAVALKAAPHPWLRLIEVRVHGDDPELLVGKPSPEVYLLAAARLGVEPERCWAFEDSAAGAWSAADAGCLVHVMAADGAPGDFPPAAIWLDSLEQVQL